MSEELETPNSSLKFFMVLKMLLFHFRSFQGVCFACLADNQLTVAKHLAGGLIGIVNNDVGNASLVTSNYI